MTPHYMVHILSNTMHQPKRVHFEITGRQCSQHNAEFVHTCITSTLQHLRCDVGLEEWEY